MASGTDRAAAWVEASLDALGVNPKRANEYALQAAQIADVDLEVQLRVANVLVALDDLDGAARVLSRVALAMDADCTQFAEFAFLLGSVALQRGDSLLVAETMLAEAFRRVPEELEHAYAYTSVLLGRGRFADALRVVSAATRHHPADPQLADLTSFVRAHRVDVRHVLAKAPPAHHSRRRKRGISAEAHPRRDGH